MLRSRGMSLSHSTTISALAACIGLEEGTGYSSFTIILILSFVVSSYKTHSLLSVVNLFCHEFVFYSLQPLEHDSSSQGPRLTMLPSCTNYYYVKKSQFFFYFHVPSDDEYDYHPCDLMQ
ncbi:hypothetical protein R6Q59_021564 [Mikania micrantha]